MKIKLSKSQWENIGKTAGWMSPDIKFHPDDPNFANDLSHMTEEDWKKFDQARKEKESPKICPECKGNKFITEKIRNLGTLEYRDSLEVCPMCKGKGKPTEEDYATSRHRQGIGPCPNCN